MGLVREELRKLLMAEMPTLSEAGWLAVLGVAGTWLWRHVSLGRKVAQVEQKLEDHIVSETRTQDQMLSEIRHIRNRVDSLAERKG